MCVVLLLLLLLLSCACAVASIRAELVGSKVPLAETFLYYDTEYILFSERVTWDEAAAICPSHGAQLATVDDAHKADFLGETMADANTEMEDVWVGGRRVSDVWTWTSTNKLLAAKIGADGYPPWARTPRRKGKDCLAMDRRGHDLPLFIDLSCRLKRPFFCEKVNGGSEGVVPKTSRRVQLGTSKFTLYHGRYTWNDAVSFCRQHDKRLAIIPNKETAWNIAQAMTKSRPDFESVWIGGQYQYGSWLWVSTGQKIASTSNLHTGFPPWRFNHTRKSSGCLLFDRHVCDAPVFLEAKCSRTRDFLCEEVVTQEEHLEVQPLRIQKEHQMFEMVPLNRTWSESVVVCRDKGGYLISLEDRETLDYIIDVMADYSREVRHVWVGGVLEGKQWVWERSHELIPFPAVNGYPPWCDNDTRTDMACLNVDRADHNRALFYGLECNTSQPFICRVDCQEPEPPKNGQWTCSLPLQNEDRVCQLDCDDGRVQYGSSVIRCSLDGWLGSQQLPLAETTAECTSLKANSKKVQQKLVDSVLEDNVDGLMFVVEDTETITEVEYKAQLQFVDSIIGAVPLSERVQAGLLAYSDTVRVVVDYNQTDTCAMADMLGGRSGGNGAVSYEQAFKSIQQEIERSGRVNKKTIVVFLTGSPDNGSSYEEVVATLAEDSHILFAVGIGPAVSTADLANMVTIGHDNNPNFFHYNNYETLAGVSQYIIDGYRDEKLPCPKKYQVEVADFGIHDTLEELDPHAEEEKGESPLLNEHSHTTYDEISPSEQETEKVTEDQRKKSKPNLLAGRFISEDDYF